MDRIFWLLLACGDLVRDVTFGCQAYSPEDAVSANSKLREAALDQHLTGGRSVSIPSCGWVVHYNRWEPTFDKGEYEPPTALGGAHCLDACCSDPSCVGLTLESNEKYQCYKYSTLPDNLNAAQGVRLGNAQWLLHKDPAWSIFIKANAGSALWKLALPTPSVVTDSPRALPSVAASPAAGHRNNCEWGVHYDTWMPSFDPGEFEHNDNLGGVHCLEACCQDPACKGLALESSEQYQCYKYSILPASLDVSRGMPLGNAKWLLEKKAAWSIFVKSVVSEGVTQPQKVADKPVNATDKPPQVADKPKVMTLTGKAGSESRELWNTARSPDVLPEVLPPSASVQFSRLAHGVGWLSVVILLILYICVPGNRRSATKLLFALGGSYRDPERLLLLEK